MEGEACTNFVDSKAIDGRCRFIDKTDQSLVRGSPFSKTSLKVWTKETIETGFVFNNPFALSIMKTSIILSNIQVLIVNVYFFYKIFSLD
jgi:hypothetical protein